MRATDGRTATERPGGPELSLVMPCYDEEEVVARTVAELFQAFDAAGRRLELIAVDNGSRDRTGAILAGLAASEPRLVVARVEVNEGYGNGILAGLQLARAPWVGIVCADGQVAAGDVARLFALADPEAGPRLLKVRRRFRRDGLRRKIVSVLYNLLMAALYPGLGSIDVNGTPKLLPREALAAMGLASKDWFLDAEILIRARTLRLPVVEVDVAGYARGGGKSNVRASTCLEFARHLFLWRVLGRGRPVAPDSPAGVLRGGVATRR